MKNVSRFLPLTHDSTPEPTHDPTPELIRATGFPLPADYVRFTELGLSGLPPWELLSGESFLRRYGELNAPRGASEGSSEANRLLVPFAERPDRKQVACFCAVPRSPQVIILGVGGSFDRRFTQLPDFGAWVRLAMEDFLARGVTPSPEAELPDPGLESSARSPQPLPLDSEPQPAKDSRTTTRKHLMRVLCESELDLGFVSVEAGDQPLRSASMRRHHERVKRERGERLYADMLFVLTQHRYPERMARWLWKRILRHKQELGERLGRPVEVTVASLDYLNSHQDLVEGSLVLCSEDELSQAADVALRDGLTGLFDQATLKLRLKREIERVKRYGGQLSLILLDLDRFKALNDEHGHLAGDGVLAELGQLIEGLARSVDIVARYGGEEFAVLLPETSSEDAWQFAERARLAIQRHFAETFKVTVSLGVATYPGDGLGPTDLISAADDALYRSKQGGRNRTSGAFRWPIPAGSRARR